MTPKALALLAVLGLAACAAPSAQMTANPYPPPPALRTEMMPKPPISEEQQLWQPGHWDWNSASYEWREGRWIQKTGQSGQWLPGFWSNESGAWVWVPAHWI